MLIFNQLRFSFSSLHLLASCILFHTGRHTFGTTITLTKGIQLETLSKMMGHKHIKTTRIYAEITARKVEEDMNLLDEKIGNQFELAG
nr:tyrosine-type recombinase/integrase [Odoribacter splanchnicus]